MHLWNKMLKLLYLSVFLPPVLCQYRKGGIRADVTYNENNDRFNLSQMWDQKNKLFNQQRFSRRGEEYAIPRRSLQSDDDNQLYNTLRLRAQKNTSARRFEDFAYHDEMDSNEGGTISDFEENLKHFMAKVRRHLEDKRRETEVKEKGENELYVDQVLLYHAVPVTLEVDGYMRMPSKMIQM